MTTPKGPPASDGAAAADPRDTLAARRKAIEEQMAAIEAGAAATVSGGIGFGKRVGEGTNIAVERVVEVAIHDSLRAELEMVKRAEARHSSGAAGRCDRCDQVIPPERLEALPWAVTCVSCAGP